MADYLVYWHGLWEDHGEWSGSLKDWWTRDPDLYHGVGRGDSLWVVSSGGPKRATEWRLVSRIVVAQHEVRMNGSKYGKYHLIGSPRRRVGFDLEVQPDFAAILRLLRFASGRRITIAGARVGKLLQKPRRLAPPDTALLEDYAKCLE